MPKLLRLLSCVRTVLCSMISRPTLLSFSIDTVRLLKQGNTVAFLHLKCLLIAHSDFYDPYFSFIRNRWKSLTLPGLSKPAF